MTAHAHVIGAGPVGQTTALLLASYGLRVTLTDAAPAREPVGSKSICQQRDVLDLWTHLGAAAITAEGHTWTTARTFHRDREIHSRTFPPTTGTPPFVNLSQARTEAILDTRIAAQPRIRYRRGHTVTALEPADLAHPRPRVHGADGSTTTADYVVVCTGARDRLRDSLDIGFDGTTHPDRFLICDINARLPHRTHERHFHFDPAANPGRQILTHPCPNDTHRIDWQVPADYRLDPADLHRRVHAVTGTTDFTVEWHTVYRFHSRIATTFHTGRIFLVGDVAHLYAPFGARGLNSGIADAQNLAWKIAAHAAGTATDALLDTYHAERHAAARENRDVVDTTMAFLAPTTPQGHRHRARTLDRAHTDPTVAAGIDSGRFAEPYWYPHTPLSTPAPHRPPATRPPQGHLPPPAPGTSCPDAPLPDGTPLRRRLHGHHTVLTRDPDDAPAPPGVSTLRLSPDTADAIDLRPDETWLVRPDTHLAATLRDATGEALTRAHHRSLGR